MRSAFLPHVYIAAIILFTGWTAGLSAQSPTPNSLDDLKGLPREELESLFRSAEIGHPLLGPARGRLLDSTDRHFVRLKIRASNAIWKGKTADAEGNFVNRWLGGVNVIGSHYTIGTSWVDGRPSVIMEYAPGTPVFANTHDELREIAPGLYLGPLYDRFPCPKLRGWMALELEPCKATPCKR